jgi:hypothetical protein
MNETGTLVSERVHLREIVVIRDIRAGLPTRTIAGISPAPVAVRLP